MNPIILSPSSNEDTLVNSINLAILTNATLELLPGYHLTKRGVRQKIKVGANGLHIKGTLSSSMPVFSSIKRPNGAIEIHKTDDNYGLFFIPDDPTPAELALITTWYPYTDAHGVSFQYAVLMRGNILIEGVELDCNMGNQGLAVGQEECEHSAMVGFAGTSVEYATGALAGKRVYIAFENVKMDNIRTIRGGFADDIWISRGYFRPNIGTVSITNIHSSPRLNSKRTTISVSGLVQNMIVGDAFIYGLECEDTVAGEGTWSERPGLPLPLENKKHSFWKLNNITCDILDLAAKGKAINLEAVNIVTRKAVMLSETSGFVNNSIFRVVNTEGRRLFRMDDILFYKVKWLFTAIPANAAVDAGKVNGLRPTSQYGDICKATFRKNKFLCDSKDADIKSGQLIDSEYSSLLSNTVNLRFEECIYDARFGSGAADDPNNRFSQTNIALVKERGDWFFNRIDFGGRLDNRAIKVIHHPPLPDGINVTILP